MSLFARSDKIFWEKYPELQGRKLTNTPEDVEYRKEYMKILEDNKKPQTIANKKVAQPIQECSNKKGTNGNEETKNEKCKVEKIKIKKGEEGYELIVGESVFNYEGVNYEGVNFLEIVSGPKSKKSDVTIDTEGLVGPCGEKHIGKTFNLNESDVTVISKTDNQLKIKIFSVDIKKEVEAGYLDKFATAATANNRFKLFYNIVDAFVNKENYCIPHTISYSICGSNKNINIRVYPKLKLSASIGYKLEAKGIGDRSKFLPERDAVNDNGLQYEFKVDHDGIELINLQQKTETTHANRDAFKYTQPDELAIDSFLYRFNLAKRAFRDSCASLVSDKSQEIKITFNPKINAECEIVEIPNTSLVGKKYSFEIGLDPLIGVEAKIDVSGAMLKAILPPINPFLTAAIGALEYFDLAEIFLGFIVSGEISVNAQIDNFIVCKNPFKIDVAVKGSIKIRLEGKVASAKHYWKIQYSVGAKAGAASGIEVDDTNLSEDNNGLFFPVKLNFLGVMLYGQAWANVGASIESSNVSDYAKIEKKQSSDAIGNSETGEIDDLKDSEKKVLIEPSILLEEKFYIWKNQK